MYIKNWDEYKSLFLLTTKYNMYKDILMMLLLLRSEGPWPGNLWPWILRTQTRAGPGTQDPGSQGGCQGFRPNKEEEAKVTTYMYYILLSKIRICEMEIIGIEREKWGWRWLSRDSGSGVDAQVGGSAGKQGWVSKKQRDKNGKEINIKEWILKIENIKDKIEN